MTRPFETAALIFRAAVSLRLHKPMTTCRDTVADWRLFCRVPFAFSIRSAKYSYNFQPSSDRCKSAWQQVLAISFWNKSCYHIEIPRGTNWASVPNKRAGIPVPLAVGKCLSIKTWWQGWWLLNIWRSCHHGGFHCIL